MRTICFTLRALVLAFTESVADGFGDTTAGIFVFCQTISSKSRHKINEICKPLVLIQEWHWR
jgi:hypothetical protein